METIVIGLGAVGSAALYHLTQMGVRARGLDRFAPPHTMGSTHGGSRIIRKAYAEGSQYLPLLRRAYTLWQDLQQQWDEDLYDLCGGLNIGRSGSEFVESARRSAEIMGSPCEYMSAGEARSAWPAFHIPDDCAVLFDAEAGYIRPERCVAAHLALASRAGAAIEPGEEVVAWSPDGSGFSVRTQRRSYLADRVIICSGAWVADLVPELRPVLKIERVTNTWFSPRAGAQQLGPDRCPVFMYEYEGRNLLYGLPDLGRGVKAGLHYAGRLHDHVSGVDRRVRADDEAATRAKLEGLLPQAAGEAAHSAVCLYTNTPDKHYFIGALRPGVAAASACSGHGFKVSSAVGEALARLSAGERPAVSVDAFQWRW